MGYEIRKPHHLKSGQVAATLSKTMLNPEKMPDFEWSDFLMVGTIAIAFAIARPFKYRTI